MSDATLNALKLGIVDHMMKHAVERAKGDSAFIRYLRETYTEDSAAIMNDAHAFAAMHHCWLAAQNHTRIS